MLRLRSGSRSLFVRVDIKLHTGDALPGGPVEVGVDLVSEPERGDRFEKNILLHAEIPEGSDCHVAADPGETIKV